MQDIQVLKDLNAIKRLRTEAALNVLQAKRRQIDMAIAGIQSNVDAAALKLQQSASHTSESYDVDVTDFHTFDRWKVAQSALTVQLQTRRAADESEILTLQDELKSLIVRDENLDDMLKLARKSQDAETLDIEGDLAQTIWSASSR